jgi:predicted ATPase
LLAKEVRSGSSNSGYCQAIYEAISSWQIYHFHDTAPTAALRQPETIQDNKVLKCDASNIAPYLLRLKQDHHDAYREILNSVRMVIPFLKDFLLEVTDSGAKRTVNLSWQQEGSDYPMQPHHFSDGSLRFICLATALLQPDPPSTIIIDEPELGLHHCAIPILAELIRDAAQSTQLIIATQSPALIDKFGIEDVVVVNRKDGASSFERLREKDFSAWLENYSVGELWSLDVIPGGPAYG